MTRMIRIPEDQAEAVLAAAELGLTQMRQTIASVMNTPLEAAYFDVVGRHVSAIAAFNVAIHPELADRDPAEQAGITDPWKPY